MAEGASKTEHRFGGVWTEVKLAAISAYSQFFTTAISNRFELWYVDPFAGTGERTATEQVGGLFENSPLSEVERQYPGSAARALATMPPFERLRFGDTKRSHVRALEQLVALYPGRDARVIRLDANSFIQSGFAHDYWTRPDKGQRKPPRALVFLDPYGLEVQWQTLQTLAACEKADVWYLANLKAAVQQVCHKHSSLDEESGARSESTSVQPSGKTSFMSAGRSATCSEVWRSKVTELRLNRTLLLSTVRAWKGCFGTCQHPYN
jgi:three-Cys-motif partner protein